MAPLRLKRGQAQLTVYLLLSAGAVVAYLALAQAQNGEFGFPLDDAWIHQVYARNLVARGEFAFFQGEPSAGSTSPLWALLLAGGRAILGDARGWAIILGILALAGSAFLASRIALRLDTPQWVAVWLVPLFTIFEWHMTWAAVSGMEILLFVLISLTLVDALFSGARPFILGLLVGTLTLTRPEGAVLGGLVGLAYVASMLRAGKQRERAKSLAVGSFALVGGFLLPVVPYLLFNYWTAGSLLPNTFYAKTQEYAALLSGSSLPARWAGLFRQPLLGGQLLLIPGFVWLAGRLAKRKDLKKLVPVAWVFALPLLYAVRLPVDYQYGRYEMPIIPFLGIYGIVGTAELVKRIPVRVIRRTWAISAAVLVAAFAWLGANEYARSVAIINCEMVATARWTAANLPPGSLIAAHDIGAQGYFDSHRILDLAGLVSPEVIPIIRDEPRLADWIREKGAEYSVFFPTWYPGLAGNSNFVSVHAGDCAMTRESGEADLVVYKITPLE